MSGPVDVLAYPNVHAALLAMFGERASRLADWDKFAPTDHGLGVGDEPVEKAILAAGLGSFTCGDSAAVMSFPFVNKANRGHMVVVSGRDGALRLCWGS